ncbi:hypothetical protein N7486_009013 [Penicillium sp. IBT 16267x]|nr:hypothetical protein N7486_009013 [Penicillium sp. IBT 16267x]
MENEITLSSRLEEALRYLLKSQATNQTVCECGAHQKGSEWIFDTDTWSELQALQDTLCQRPAIPKLPTDILEHIEAVIQYNNQHKLLTSTTSISPDVTIRSQAPNSSPLRISCWKGDITTLTDVTAIVNAANSQLEGCFRPEHKCIDNVIHSAAGPRLRDACHALIKAQGHQEPIGSAKVTPGFLLPAEWILHTVGPQLNHRENPTAKHKAQLTSCYRACLDAVDSLPPLADGRKVVAFCCISTGLFAFPSALAASIAVETVVSWYKEHSKCSITDIIFDTFLEKDEILYRDLLSGLKQSGSNIIYSPPCSLAPPQTSVLNPSILKARAWLEDASSLIITAGAGLSTATGLDYTSTTLFDANFPAFKAKGLRRLYDVFGYSGWDSPAQKWGYFFLHMDIVRRWPVSPVYGLLRDLVGRFEEGGRYHIRTTNADGFFIKNGFPAERISTPQGQYKYLQCYAKCRADAVFLSAPFIDAALPFLDPVSQVLTDEALVPKCRFCGGELTLCVRGGNYFNSGRFRKQERVWQGFVEELDNGGDEQAGATVILELGVGLNTPGVLRWPNEDLVSESSNRQFKLIRVGMEASGCVPWDLEEENLAVGITGDIGAALELLS